MRNSFVLETLLSVVLVGLAVFVFNPFGIFMPDAFTMALACAALVSFGVFAAFLWRERSTDEREMAHASSAGRVAYLAGAGTLTLGIVAQGLRHAVDPWLLGALTVMVLAKLIARTKSDLTN